MHVYCIIKNLPPHLPPVCTHAIRKILMVRLRITFGLRSHLIRTQTICHSKVMKGRFHWLMAEWPPFVKKRPRLEFRVAVRTSPSLPKLSAPPSLPHTSLDIGQELLIGARLCSISSQRMFCNMPCCLKHKRDRACLFQQESVTRIITSWFQIPVLVCIDAIHKTVRLTVDGFVLCHFHKSL